jgi:signal peptidase II
MVRIYLPAGKTVSVGDFIRLQQVRNPATAFGIIKGESWLLFIGSIIILFILVFTTWKWAGPGNRWFQAGLGLIIGGAIGNIIDRVALGEVIDFVDLKIWPVFNVADTAIVIGVIIAMAMLIRDTWTKSARGA